PAPLGGGRSWQQLLHSGQRALPQPALLLGPVTRGFQRGRRLGFPTANLASDALVDADRLPSYGVYCGRAVLLDEAAAEAGSLRSYRFTGPSLPAILSWGSNPQFGLDKALFEVHIIHWPASQPAEFYGRTLACLVTHYLRDEARFPGGIDQLTEAIRLDLLVAKALLGPLADAQDRQLKDRLVRLETAAASKL
ncbi:hypothetical protein BOX15_Mlig025405g12, partial [Macrostomum lignano]